MVRKKAEKIASLLVAVVVTAMSFFRVEDWSSVGIYDGCTIVQRLIYPFFHVNPVHAILNSWCLLSIVFIYETSAARMVAAYIAAVAIPSFILTSTPTVGLSGLVYVLFGSLSFEVLRKWYYQAWMLFYISVGFLFPNTNGWIHLYCYLVGLAFALLTKPIKICR